MTELAWALAERLGRVGPVLDAGAGSGVLAAELADRGVPVVLIDVTDQRDPVARRLPFLRADAGALPVRSGSCTGVHLARALHHVGDWPAAVAELVRVVALGGPLCLSLGGADETPYDGLGGAALDAELARHGWPEPELLGRVPHRYRIYHRN